MEFAAGEASKVISVIIVDDDVEEPDEQFTVELSNPRGGGTLLSHTAAKTTITIINDDFPGTFQVPSRYLPGTLTHERVHTHERARTHR